MDDAGALERDTIQAQNHQAPADWADAQESLAAASGLSVLLVEGHQPPALEVSNNNSICLALQSSPRHAQLCEPYCGMAYERAMEAGTPAHYRCHAGLHCFTMPVSFGTGRAPLAVIGGRAFLTSADYRALAERFRVGDLQDLLSTDLFKNVIFASHQDLDDLARRIVDVARGFRADAAAEAPPVTPVAPAAAKAPVRDPEPVPPVGAGREETARLPPADAPGVKPHAPHTNSDAPPVKQDAGSRTSLLHNRYFPVDSTFNEACGAAMQALAEKHGLTSLALLLRDKSAMLPVFMTGHFKNIPLQVEVGSKDARLFLTARAGTSLVLRQTAEGFKPLATTTKPAPGDKEKRIELFPLVVGDEVKAALLVGDSNLSDEKRRAISSYCRDIALPLEVLRLRNELEQRARFADCLQNFSERINTVDPAETYNAILQLSADLLRAERGSLMLFDEASNELALKAAVGMRSEVATNTRLRMGEGVSGAVLQKGRPLVVRDVELGGHAPAPAERSYKTKSFISFPIAVGGRNIGVLNVTDKAGGGSYDEVDLSLLESIAPQMALALDRADWQEKAMQFQLMSITDPLTGMLNRRYLVERLAEELKRSQRHDYPMSFMMIDIDDFKLYNDRSGHPAGDLALEMTSQCLKSALRAADVASRYGGEEFCILLPQTSLAEAQAIGERIRRRIERMRFPHGKKQPLGAVTVSIGISAFYPGVDTPEAIIQSADRALYQAKNLGKNRVEVCEPPEAATAQASHAAENPK
jgi:diguanylate cyclase (GGDEF)-like protein